MTDKELKRLSRTDLLRLLIRQTEENERLNARVAKMEQELSRRTIVMEKSGSIAEAAMGITNIFDQAQDVANRYLESIQSKQTLADAALAEAQQKLTQTNAACARQVEQTTQKCRRMEEQTKALCTRLLQQAKQSGSVQFPQGG